MSNEVIAPLVEVGPGDEAAPGTFGAAQATQFLPEAKNYAQDAKVRAYILNELIPTLTETRHERQALEEEWRAIRRMEMLKHDDGQRYMGRSNAYLPIFSRIVASLVSTLSRGLFPSDEYMDVFDRGTGDPERTKPVKAYLQWEFERVGRVRNNIKPFLRQFTSLGNGVLKYWYKKKVLSQGRLTKVSDVERVLRTQPSFKPVNCYEGLAVSARNIFNVYIHPITAESLDDASVIFEDVDVSRSYIEQMAKTGKWEKEAAKHALEAPTPDTHQSNRVDQLNDSLGVTSTTASNLRNRNLDTRTLTEVWTYMELPSSAYIGDEQPGSPVPVRVLLAGDQVLEVTRNPFFHQRPPYLLGRQNVDAGLVYGTYGFGRTARHLQYLANDFANQANDCGNYALNPINKVNPGLLAGPLRPLAPGVTWYMTDVKEGQSFDRPPTELIGAGLQMVQTWVGMAQDFGGAPPILQGVGAGKAAKTATGAQILQRNAMAPLQDIVEDLELDVMIPLMFGTWMNAQQYREEEVMTLVAGDYIEVSPEDLIIDPEFRWLASSQSANAQQRAQQAITLLQALMPMMPIMMQQGYVVDPVPLIKRVYADGFGFRGFSEFIRKAEMMPAGGMQPGMPVPPGVQMEQGDRIRSALEQVGGMTGEMAPGEGEDFMAVRAQADDLAGMMGGGGGMF